MKKIKILNIACLLLCLTACSISTEKVQAEPPSATQFIKILLKEGSYIEESCNTEFYGPTLQDKLANLLAPEGSAKKIIVSYDCLSDKRETRLTKEVISVWLCSITGQGINENNIEIFSTSINAYLDKRNLAIVDLSCL